jgi:hypothetical protein
MTAVGTVEIPSATRLYPGFRRDTMGWPGGYDFAGSRIET